MSYKKGAFKNFTWKQLRQSLFLVKLQAEACNFIKKDTLAQVFSSKVCETFKNRFFYKAPLVAASGINVQFPVNFF